MFSLNLKRILQTVGIQIGNNIESQIPDLPPELGGPAGGGWDNYATNGNFDGTAIEDVNAQMVVRTTQSDPSGSPTYSSFNTFANGTFKGRGFQFRATLQTSDPAQNMLLQQLGYTAEMSSRTEQSAVIASGGGAKAVTFSSPFFVGTSALGNLNNFSLKKGAKHNEMPSLEKFIRHKLFCLNKEINKV